MKGVNINRRQFVKKGIDLLPYVGVGALTYPLLKFSFYTDQARVALSIPLSELKEPITQKGTVFVLKKADEIKVFDAHCTHMGCLLHFSEKEKLLVCPCHNSRFSLEGEVLKGPATRNLDTLSFTSDEKNLLIG